MAIIALIATPLVMSIIRKARISADKRSIDAYGRSIELAIAGYLMDTGDFPTSTDQLTVEYSGDEAVCTTTQLNADSSVYLAGCTVAGRSVENYTYGSDKSPTYTAYSVGDEVTYNNINYYVIKDSSASEDSVTLLKAEPLTVTEVNQYGVGHVNMNVPSSQSYYQTAYDSNGYGGMTYYSSEDCNPTGWNGCTTDYTQSEIKYVVDAWKTAKAPMATEARLLLKEEIDDNFEFEEFEIQCGGCGAKGSRIKSTWMYNSNYWYWTMSPYNSSDLEVWRVLNSGQVGDQNFSDASGGSYISGVVRPVIVLPKSAID